MNHQDHKKISRTRVVKKVAANLKGVQVAKKKIFNLKVLLKKIKLRKIKMKKIKILLKKMKKKCK